MKLIYQKIIVTFLAGFFVFSACDMDTLNVNPSSQLSIDDVWQDAALIDLYLADIYRRMHHGLDEVMLGSMSDNLHFIHGYGTALYVQSEASASNIGAFGRTDLQQFRWGHLYTAIRQTNIMLDNIDEATVSEDFRDNVKGEVHFLRAYFYHNLVRAYGGVPIVTQVYELEDDFLVARSTFEESVNFVVEEAERAAALLPDTPRDLGRTSRGAALALKSRILTYAASDLFFNNPASDLTGFPSGNQQAWHQRARDAARDVIDTGLYELFNRHDDPSFNYEQLFIVNEDHEENIFSRYFVGSRDWADRWLPHQFNAPNGYRGWAGNTPIQSLVDTYEMTDGSEFDWNNPEHASAPYENRDPRFYASILFDGAPWVDPPSFRDPYDAHGHIQTFQTVTTPNGEYPGVDTRNGPIEDWNGSYSRYYLRKFLDPTMPPQQRQETPYPYFRYGEIILNYVEANIGLGNEAEARTWLNMIRQRAGMPDVTDSGDALVRRYQNERRVELFGEEHRYFDIRRWMIAPDVITDAYGITITAQADDRRDRSTYHSFTYNPTDRMIQSRSWADRLYFSPIPFAEMNRNDQLVQNPGY